MKKTFRLLFVAALAFAAVAAQAETYVFMVGINDYPEPVDKEGKPIKDKDGNIVSDDLKGCVNDIKNYNDLLVNKFGVKSENIRTVLDGKANKEGFTTGMKWLLSTAKAGDQIFFFYSGHGTQIDDTTEEDKKQEAIVLADGTLVTGAIFREVSQLTTKAGINGNFIFDSCYSGGMTRETASFDGAPATARRKFLDPKHISKSRYYTPSEGSALKAIPRALTASQGGSHMFLMAGREDQPTTDLSFKDASKPARGLFSLIFGLLVKDNPTAPVEAVMKATVDLLKEKGFAQVPQMEFSSADRGKLPFFVK